MEETTDNPEPQRKQIIEAIATAIAASPEGYHAFLLVVRFGGRFTKEDLQTIDVLKAVFEENFVRNFSILVVTYGDNFKSGDMEYVMLTTSDFGRYTEWTPVVQTGRLLCRLANITQ
ncbi:hypothetical protein Btru_033106 [Bulinus truncatus]|nr:hypothetical protein Btru_033106 [Bulinus truncatus]